jgi:hypothetical protein
MTILRSQSFSLLGAGEPERVSGRYVSADFCAVFGIKPVLGRAFAPREDEPVVGPVVLISHALWQRKFGVCSGHNPQGCYSGHKSFSVIGVLPDDFTLFRNADVFRANRPME